MKRQDPFYWDFLGNWIKPNSVFTFAGRRGYLTQGLSILWLANEQFEWDFVLFFLTFLLKGRMIQI